MNHLISIRTNILYAKNKKKNEEGKTEDEYKRFHELIFLVDKPTYRLTNDRDVVRERGVEELRFNVSDEAFKNMLEILTQLKDAKNDEVEE